MSEPKKEVGNPASQKPIRGLSKRGIEFLTRKPTSFGAIAIAPRGAGIAQQKMKKANI